jgi:hypothetical protein
MNRSEWDWWKTMNQMKKLDEKNNEWKLKSDEWRKENNKFDEMGWMRLKKINEMKNNARYSEWKWKSNEWRWGNQTFDAQEWMNVIDKSKWDGKWKIK